MFTELEILYLRVAAFVIRYLFCLYKKIVKLCYIRYWLLAGNLCYFKTFLVWFVNRSMMHCFNNVCPYKLCHIFLPYRCPYAISAFSSFIWVFTIHKLGKQAPTPEGDVFQLIGIIWTILVGSHSSDIIFKYFQTRRFLKFWQCPLFLMPKQPKLF